MTTKTVYFRDECGSDEVREIEIREGETLQAAAEQAAQEWVEEGAWGDEGGSVMVWWATDDDQDDEHRIEIELPVNHESLIRKAVLDAASEYTYREMVEKCGPDPDCHDWTSRGEGGCDDNPGVYSLGGTAMSFASHCRKCGLHRTTLDRGWQRNPGESRYSYTYRLLTEDEMAKMRQIGAIDED